jgi:hypothetical protein
METLCNTHTHALHILKAHTQTLAKHTRSLHTLRKRRPCHNQSRSTQGQVTHAK